MMLDNSQHWQLFGFDMRNLGRYWTAAWRDLLWSHDSPVRNRLDEVVTLRSAGNTSSYQAGKVCGSAVDSVCTAILAPDELVLSKRIAVPLQAESELDSLLELEVKSSSPFATADTRWGWTVMSRDETTIHVALAIVSASAVMTFLGREYDSHDSHAQEVWVEVDTAMVVLQGFGEDLREHRYRKRLRQSAALVAAIALLLMAMAAVSAMMKSAELERVERLASSTSSAASDASQLRSLLAVANETIAAANEVVATYPNPHAEIARLTRLLDDEASISSFSMSGPEIKLRGRAINAAEVMAELTDEPAYIRVVAPQPIVRMSDGQEQFYLNILIGSEVSE